MSGVGRRLGIDLGDRRIGLAVAVDDAPPRGLPTMMRAERASADALRLAVICGEQRIERLVIGLPLHSDGRASTQGEKTLRWADEIARHLRLPVMFIDERYSSERAKERVGRQGGGAGGGEPGPRRRAAYRASIDQAAAELILEDEADPSLHVDPGLIRARGEA